MSINLDDIEEETRCAVCLGKLTSHVRLYYGLARPSCPTMGHLVVLHAKSEETDERTHNVSRFPAGVIKDARLIAQCMHRFCALCIEKWLRQSK